MRKKNMIKYISLVILITVLTSIFSVPVFATNDNSGEDFQNLTWWEQVGLFIFGIIFIIFAIPISVIAGISSIIKELIPVFAELWESIVNYFAGL